MQPAALTDRPLKILHTEAARGMGGDATLFIASSTDPASAEGTFGLQSPALAQIQAALPGVDYRALLVDPDARTIRFLKPGMRIVSDGAFHLNNHRNLAEMENGG